MSSQLTENCYEAVSEFETQNACVKNNHPDNYATAL